MTWDYKNRHLQGLTRGVYGQYCCLFALYMDIYPQQFFTLVAVWGQFRPTGGANVRVLIWGHPAAWRLRSMLPQLHIKVRYFRKTRHSKSNMADAGREAVIDFEFLRSRQTKTVVKELCVASATAGETFLFKSPYKMADRG